MTKTIILVRHGLSEFNKQGRMQGSSNASMLSDSGRIMAKNVAQSLTQTKLDYAMTSPLSRAQETAEIALTQQDNPVKLETVDDLRETEMYMLEGMTFNDIAAQYPDEYRAWKYDADNFVVIHGGAEVFPIRDLYSRSAVFWQELIPQVDAQTILLVSHGGTIQALINTALGLSSKHHHTFQQSNCGISCLRLEAHANHYTLQRLNDTSPQGEFLPKLKAGKQGLRTLVMPCDELLERHGVQTIQKLNIDINPMIHESVNLPDNLEKHLCGTNNSVSREQMIETLVDKQSGNPALENIAVFAPVAVIRDVLTQGLYVNTEFVNRIEFQQNTLTVVHNSESHPTPIMQCLNIII